MKIVPRLLSDWPKLAWSARVCPGRQEVEVLHGPAVEIGPDWCVEAVWDGEFSDGSFDRTDLVFGSGLRVRDDNVVLVSSSTMLDRLWYCHGDGAYHISNSLPVLLACAGLALRDDYTGYVSDIESMRLGLGRYMPAIPTTSLDVHVEYFRNLLYDGRSLQPVTKSDRSPAFRRYADYQAFVMQTAGRLGGNMASRARKHGVEALAGVSRGYDSGAAAAVARQAGCTQAVTIVNASSLLPRSDSGMEIAARLGLDCRPYRQRPSAYQYEQWVWAAAGVPAGLNLTIFEYPQPLCLFFSGYRGDTVWDRQAPSYDAPLAAPGTAGLGMCEFRLVRGLFHCPVPFWGCQKLRDIQAISLLPEMAPWTLGTDYDRPIPRRLLEEAGVPRQLFGRKKEVTSTECFFLWPFTQQARESFAAYLTQRSLYAPSRATLWLLRKLTHLEHLVYANIAGRFTRAGRPGFQPTLKGQELLFAWANNDLARQYKEGLGSTARGA